MRELPTGTVTMLFSDIEGSTSMLHRLGAHWGEALSAQRAILREVFEQHGGFEMGTEGDSFFVVFERAQQALLAAVTGQRRLIAHAWPEGVPLRVRMGMHTGEPQRHEDGYIGIDVHRAARIAATASGGQVVVSAATQLLLAATPTEVQLRDLGWHRLKDLADPELLYDVVGPGLPEDFPPLRSLGTMANLPTYATELVGRAGEVEAVCRDFEEGARLVTLTGPGGTGKTRLGVAVAGELQRRRPCDTYFVELHTADRMSLMWSAIAEAIGATADVDVLPDDRVHHDLDGRAAFLVLDNLEQIEDAEVVVADLLSRAPDVSILATSRRPLHLVDERVRPIDPLLLPPAGRHDLASASRSAAVDLFVRRATMVQPSFALTAENTADLVELCRHLDGLPLAIELTAARARLLSPRAMLRRIEKDAGGGLLAATDRIQRQRTVAAAVAWSYELLDEAHRRVFRRLGVFSDRVDLDAMESVVGLDEALDPLDAVAHLVDVSLLTVGEGPDGEPRVSMLETIRRFARDQLWGSGESAEIRLRHARWCEGVAEQIADVLHGPNQMKALDRMDAVEQDIRAALNWCLVAAPDGSPDRRETGYRLLNHMTTYWYRFGYAAEGRGWYERALEIIDDEGAGDSEALIDALHGAGILLLQRNDVRSGIRVLKRALESARAIGDRSREGRESNSLGIGYRAAGDHARARELILRSIDLGRELGNPQREATGLSNLVHVHMDAGEYAEAVEAGWRAVAADEAIGDPWGIAISKSNLGFALLNAEGAEPAYAHLASVAQEAIGLADVELSIETIECFAAIYAGLGDAERAALLLGACDAARAAADMPRAVPETEHLFRFVDPVRETADPADWAANYDAGTALDIDGALAAALARREVAQER